MAENQRPGFYIEELNKYKQKHNVSVTYQCLAHSAELPGSSFVVQVVIGSRRFPKATGSSKKEAKNGAAKAALEALNMLNTAENVSSLPAQGLDIGNYIGQVNTFAQKKGLEVIYHCRPADSGHVWFCCTCKVNGKIYGSGEGSSKQAAKQKAAQMTCNKLHAEEAAAKVHVTSGPSPSSSGASSSRNLSFDSDRFSTPELSSRSSCSDRNHSDCWDSSLLSSPSDASGPSERATPSRFSPVTEKASNRYTTEPRFAKEFTDIKQIGSGGYGQVFKARHKIDKKIYVIKRVRYSSQEVEREVQALATLEHQNVVLYYDCWPGLDRCFRGVDESSTVSNGVEDGEDSPRARGPETKCLFIKMEFCPGGTLEQWIDSRRGRTPHKALALHFFEQIVEGVSYIHREGYIHRDLKPSNIFLVDDKKIKIGDFGLVTCLENDSKRTSDRGTWRYMSPEQHSTKYGNEVDIFALGIIFVELTHICATYSETDQVISSLKRGKFPDSLDDREKTLLKDLVAQDYRLRPSAHTLLLTLRSWGPSAEDRKNRTV